MNRLLLVRENARILKKEDIKTLLENLEFLNHYTSTLVNKPYFKNFLKAYIDSINNIEQFKAYIKNLSLDAIFKIFQEVYGDYDKLLGMTLQYSFEIKIFENLKQYVNSYTDEVNDKKILSLFSLFNTYNTDDIKYLSEFNCWILVPLLTKVFTDDSGLRVFFFEEFKRYFKSYNENAPEFEIFQCFIEYCKKEDLKTLIGNKDSNFFSMIFNLLRKNSIAYIMKDWKNRHGINNDMDFWGFDVFKSIGDLIYKPLMEEIVKMFKSGVTDDIIFFLYNRLYERLNPEDLKSLVSNPELKFFENIFEALKLRKNIDFMIDGGTTLFSGNFIKEFGYPLREKIMETLIKNDMMDFVMLVKSQLLDYLEKEDILGLLNNSNIDFLDNLVKSFKDESGRICRIYDYEFYEWMENFSDYIQDIYPELDFKIMDKLREEE